MNNQDAIRKEFQDALLDRNWFLAARIAFANPAVIPKATARSYIEGGISYTTAGAKPTELDRSLEAWAWLFES